MLRTSIGLIGVVIALFPATIRELYELFALEDPGEVTPKPWFTSAIRAEGLLFVIVSILGGTAYRTSLYLLGVAGAVALLFPRRALRISRTYSYEDPENIEWNRGLIPAIHCFGVLYLLVSIKELTGSDRDPTEA